MESSSAAQLIQYMGTYMPTPAAPLRLLNCSSLRLPPPAAHFHIPPLQCSFPSGLLHPHYDLVKKHCDGWILDVAQPPSAAACRLLLDCVIPRLICRAIPAASSVPRLIHVAKMVSWLTIADDNDDHPGALGANDTTSAQHANSVMTILRCEEDNKSAPVLGLRALCCPNQLNGDPNIGLMVDSRVPKYTSCSKSDRKEGALEALRKLWAEMRREMTPGLRHRFVSTMEDYLHAIKVQATFRKLHRLPDMQAYLEIRRQASFILPCIALLEYALGIELEEEVYNNPLVEKFRYLALDYIFLCNDLISCKAEIGVGDYFNMPSIAYNSCSIANKEWRFQDAIDHVANMIKDLDGQCVSMLSVIQESSASPSLHHNMSFVNTYIVALCSCMSGCLAWFLETARYRNSG
nr:microbial terpene synthase-like protein 6 [Dryopteris fragrans]